MADFKAYGRHIKGSTPFRDGMVAGDLTNIGGSHADYRLKSGDTENLLRVLSSDDTRGIAERYDRAERILGEYSTAFERRQIESWSGDDYLLIETIGCVGTRAVPQRVIARLGIEICRSLERLERAGIMHLSIKPDNICFDGDRYVLTGFEYSCTPAEAAAQGRIGTPEFFAPEVWNGRYDRTTDLYALCLTMYYLLNGSRPPFYIGDSDSDLKQAIIARLKGGEIQDILSADPKLMNIVLKGVDPVSSRRWQSAGELKDALVAYLESKRIGIDDSKAARTALNIVNNCAAFQSRFELIERLGAGAFGAVFKAYDKVNRNECAIKLQPVPEDEDVAEDQARRSGNRAHIAHFYEEQLNKRFSEASISLQLSDCRHIVRVMESGKAFRDTAPGENKPIGGCVWMCMELLEPIDNAVSNERQAALIGKDICDALDYAHTKGIFHRDVKPANILYSPADGFKLGDFGIARLKSPDLNATVTGTPMLMCPELLKAYLNNEASAKYDESADLFALGLSLYKMLNNGNYAYIPYDYVGKPDSAMVSGAQKRLLKGERLPDIPNVSPQLMRILRKACEFSSRDRYRSAKVMRDAFIDFLDKSK